MDVLKAGMAKKKKNQYFKSKIFPSAFAVCFICGKSNSFADEFPGAQGLCPLFTRVPLVSLHLWMTHLPHLLVWFVCYPLVCNMLVCFVHTDQRAGLLITSLGCEAKLLSAQGFLLWAFMWVCVLQISHVPRSSAEQWIWFFSPTCVWCYSDELCYTLVLWFTEFGWHVLPEMSHWLIRLWSSVVSGLA